MPVCCRCNGSGRCLSCSCVKLGKLCVDCLPSRKGQCCNDAPAPTPHTPTISTPEVDNGNRSSSSSNVLSVTATSGSRVHFTNLSSESANVSAILDDVITDSTTVMPTAIDETLPSFKPPSRKVSSWGDLSGEDFIKAIDDAYAQVVHWRPN